jgi:outer membrane protein assembly factor BamD (BamD/ComL family)
MKQTILVLMMVVVLAVAGCTNNNAGELFETAEFEELQKNHAHAARLYREILEKHPDSKYAGKARERLNVLEKSQH